jgi:hypothetical protein
MNIHVAYLRWLLAYFCWQLTTSDATINVTLHRLIVFFSSNCRVDSICFEMLVLVVREIVVDLCLDTHKFSLVM